MKFAHKHPIPAPAQLAWDMTSNPEFIAASYQKASATYKLLSSEDRDGKTFNRILVTVNESLPGFASKFIGASNLSYEQHETVDHEKMHNQWTIIVPKIASKVKATGSFSIRTTGDSCERIVEGEVKVSIPFVGGKIESVIAKQLGKSQEDIAKLLIEHLENENS